MKADADRDRSDTSSVTASGPDDELLELRRFAHGAVATSPLQGSWLPALLHGFRRESKVRTPYPFVLFDGPDEKSGGLSWSELLQRTASSVDLGAGGKALLDNLVRFEQAVGQALATPSAEGAEDLDRIRRAGLDSIDELGISEDAGTSLRVSWNLLVDSLPPGSWVPLDSGSALVLWKHSVARVVRRARKTFHLELTETVRRTRELVRLERSHQGQGGENLRVELGEDADSLIDSSRLAQVAGRQRGSVRRSDERLASLIRSLDVLEAYLAGEEGPEAAVVLEPGAPLPHGWREPQKQLLIVHDEDPCTRAAEIFDRETEAWSEILRAQKHVELELSGRFDPLRHSAWLEGAPSVLTAEAQALLPPVAAVENATRLGQERLVSLSSVLRGRRPVHVIVTLDPYDDPGASETTGRASHSNRLELAYLAIGHRRAAAHQGVLSQPLDLLQAFDHLAERPEPALHLIATSAPDATPGPWLHLGAAIEGRAHPLFVYDPIAGESWARRLELGNNPQPEADWPGYPATEGGSDHDAFTFADFALLDPRARTEFRWVPDTVESADLVPLAEHLTHREGAEAEIPYVRAMDESGKSARLVVSSSLVQASRDRLDFWHTLQELAGIGNEHVRRAVDLTREELTAAWETERQQLAAKQDAAVADATETAGALALEGVARFLLDLDPTNDLMAGSAAAGSLLGGGMADSAASATPTSGTAPGTDSATESAATTNSPTEASEVPAASADDEAMDPYVDTLLCTSCDDCLQINPRLFVYDANKQTEIKDPTAGTYAQLVEAAEKCPAKCIHPGTPLDPNEPDLDELRQRAADFN